MSHKRAIEEKHRRQKLMGNRGNAWYDPDKGFYIKYNRGRRAGGWNACVKKQSVRKIRRSKDTFQQHGKHHKLFDFWWTID